MLCIVVVSLKNIVPVGIWYGCVKVNNSSRMLSHTKLRVEFWNAIFKSPYFTSTKEWKELYKQSFNVCITVNVSTAHQE